MDKQRGRPVLVEFWDFCRVNSLRTLPYLKGWHERYADDGLRVIGSTPAASRRRATRSAVRDRGRAAWHRASRRASTSGSSCGTSTATRAGRRATCWTAQARCLDALRRGRLRRDRARDPGAARPRARPAAHRCAPRTPGRAAARPDRRPGGRATRGPYEAGGVWAVSTAPATVVVNGQPIAVDGPGAYPLIEHERHTRGELALEVGAGVDLLRDVLHAGAAVAAGAARSCPRSPSRRISRAGRSRPRGPPCPGQ